MGSNSKNLKLQNAVGVGVHPASRSGPAWVGRGRLDQQARLVVNRHLGELGPLLQVLIGQKPNYFRQQRALPPSTLKAEQGEITGVFY